MRRFVSIAIALIFAYVAYQRTHAGRVSPVPTPSGPVATAPAPAPPPASPAPVESDNTSIARAYASHARDVPVEGSGVVSRVLPDDAQGDRHQRFLVRLPSGQSVLIVHNIDIAPRVPNIRSGDEVEFHGEFVWNDKGGLVHWTHHDPSGRHKAGWLKHVGQTYQ